MRQNCKVIVDHCAGGPSQSICFSYWKHSMLWILRLVIFKISMVLKTLTILIIFDHTAVNIQRQLLRMRRKWLPSLLWKTKRTRKPGKRTKYKLQKNNRIRKNLFIWAFGNVLFVQARHWGSDVEMSKRRRKDSGGFLYAFLILLSCLVFKLSDFCLSQFTKNQVELLLAVLREGGVGIDEKEVRRRQKLFFLFLFSQKESFPVFSKKYCVNYLKFRRRNS